MKKQMNPPYPMGPSGIRRAQQRVQNRLVISQLHFRAKCIAQNPDSGKPAPRVLNALPMLTDSLPRTEEFFGMSDLQRTFLASRLTRFGAIFTDRCKVATIPRFMSCNPQLPSLPVASS